MASKNSTGKRTIPKGVTVRWVKRANMWCKTYPLNGKQVQEWHSEKPDLSVPEEN